MNMIGKFSTGIVAVAAFSAIIFANTRLDSMKPVQPAADAAAVDALQSSAEPFGSFRIVGEKQDSGLGNLLQNYTAAEFQRSEYRVAGEKLDSGLGELSQVSLNAYSR